MQAFLFTPRLVLDKCCFAQWLVFPAIPKTLDYETGVFHHASIVLTQVKSCYQSNIVKWLLLQLKWHLVQNIQTYETDCNDTPIVFLSEIILRHFRGVGINFSKRHSLLNCHNYYSRWYVCIPSSSVFP